MPGSPPIVVAGLHHSFGRGALEREILADIDLEIDSGEIVIVSGPSGSGKTTLLTLIGALRSAQRGSLKLLGNELRGASGRVLRTARKDIGYIFQQHNLIESLTARQNVQMSLFLRPDVTRSIADRKATEILETVGLGDHLDHPTEALSGGQRQRVAVARALVNQPRIVLADEPTASLDRESGREVVDLMRSLAKDSGATVLLVTHDNRILDVADRIVHLEDGRISSFTQSVIANTRHMMHLLAESRRKGELTRQLREMPLQQFTSLLEQVTEESRQLLSATERSRDEAFESMLDQALEAFTFKLGAILNAERASVYLLDRETGELWLRVAKESGEASDVKFSADRPPVSAALEELGTARIAGEVLRTGASQNVADPYGHPDFNPAIDELTGFRTRSILCCPLLDRRGNVFGVAQLLNRTDGNPFDERDERQYAEFTRSIGVILESWWLMSQQRRDTRAPGELNPRADSGA